MATRKTPAPSNTGTDPAGPDYLEAVTAEIEALWKVAMVPLVDVGGTANAITAKASLAPLDVNTLGNKFTLDPVLANTGAATLQVDDRTAKTILNRDGSAIAAGRLVPGRVEFLEDRGASYRLLGDPPPAGISLLRNVYAYQTAKGVAGAGVSAGWNAYPLNTTIHAEIPGVTFDAVTGRITLPVRTYSWVEASAYWYANNGGMFLWNVTDDAPFPGMFRRQETSYGSLYMAGKFTLAAPKVAEVRIYTGTAYGAGALGTVLNISSPSAMPEQHGGIIIESYST